jgi:hypothetical protein
MPKNITRTKTVTKDEAGNETTTENEVEEASVWDKATSIATIAGIIIALFTAIGTIIGFFYKEAQDRYTMKLAEENRERESKKIFFDKQSELYFRAVAAASAIATKNPPQRQDLDDFESTYFGSMAMVEDDDVDQAMVLFRHIAILQPPREDSKCVTSASLFLAHCVKKSLATSWSVTLGEPPELPCNEPTRSDIRNSCVAKENPAGGRNKSSTQ